MNSKWHMQLELAPNGSIATGSWREQTSPSGYYRGAVYHGTLQLIAEPMGRRMQGKWLGFGRGFSINTGDWELDWAAPDTSEARDELAGRA